MNKDYFRFIGSLIIAMTIVSSSIARDVKYPNLFADLLGASPEALNEKIDVAWQQLFYGDDDTQRIYYPVGDDMAYMVDVASNDVRSEGMSYGMMIAVQLDKQEEFNRIWKWAKTYMFHYEGGLKGYSAWHCDFEGNKLSNGTASDGEEWYVTALYFASARWGDGEGIFDYRHEADTLLNDMMNRGDAEGYYVSIFDRQEKQVVFVPHGEFAKFTDPSYHLPAFYELWAKWAPENNDFWKECAGVSREFFKKTAHPETGLMPDYANFDGTPKLGSPHEDFRYDAWRTLANVAIDWRWNKADPWQVEQSNRVLTFLSQFGDEGPRNFKLDGTPIPEGLGQGLMAMGAVAGLAADPDIARPFVKYLWEMEIPNGQYRYYDGMLYMMGLLQAGGHFRIYDPTE